MKAPLVPRINAANPGSSGQPEVIGCYAKAQKHRRFARLAEALAVTLVAMACSGQAVAQPAQVGAKASVNGRTAFTVNNAAVPNANGSAVAAAKIFHPAAGAGTDFQVNGAAANARTEAPILDALANESRTVRAPNPLNYANRAAFQEALTNQGSYINGGQIRLNGQVIANVPGLKNQIAGCTVPDAIPGNPSCTTRAGTGSFPLVPKGGAGISSSASMQRAVGANNYEFASATASQRTLANGTFQVVDNPTTEVRAAANLPAPVASAYTSNHDPMAVYWSSSSNHNITIDLSSFQMSLSTQGIQSEATGYYAVHGGVINGSSDITLPESSASPFFDLVLGFNSVNGGPPQLNGSTFQLAAVGSISDNLGNVGLGAVAIGFLGDLTLTGDTVSFATPYSLTVGVPGNQLQDVVFLDTQALTETEAATPEPSTLLLPWFGAGRTRRRVAQATP